MAKTNLKNIIGDYKVFFEDLLLGLKEAQVDVSQMTISHICYRVVDFFEYQRVRDSIKAFSSAYTEHDFNGRPISIFLFRRPLILKKNYEVSVIELLPPKPGSSYNSGLEHCSFVVNQKFDEFYKRYKAVLTGQKNRSPYCRPYFITFSSGKTVKFYEFALKKVIELDGWHFYS